jgi:hypothetical protein
LCLTVLSFNNDVFMQWLTDTFFCRYRLFLIQNPITQSPAKCL